MARQIDTDEDKLARSLAAFDKAVRVARDRVGRGADWQIDETAGVTNFADGEYTTSERDGSGTVNITVSWSAGMLKDEGEG